MVRIGDMLQIQRRAVELKPTDEYREIGLRSFGKGVFHKAPISGSELGNKRVFRILPGDLIISNVFGWEGAIAIAGESERGFIGSHRFMTWTATNSKIDPKFVFHYFSSEAGLESLRRASPGSAGRNRTLGVRAFEDLTIPLPDIAEQRAIAGRLDAMGDASQQSQIETDVVDRAARAFAQSLMSESHLPIPVGQLIQETIRFEPIDSTRSYRSAGVKWYAEGVFARDAKPAAELKALKLNRLVPGEFIYNRLFAWKGSFALTPDDELFASNEFPTFAINRSQILPEYLLGWFSLPQVWDQVLRLSTGATPTSRNRLKQEQLLALEIPLPPLAIQEEAVSTIRKVEQLRLLNSHRNRVAKALPQAARNAEFARLMG
jgi:type I restriction enzyme S subunit